MSSSEHTDPTSERTLSRAEYETMRTHDYAGPASDLLPQVRGTWPAPYWSYVLTPLGTELVATYLDDEPRAPHHRDPYDRVEFALTDDDATADQPDTEAGAGIEAVGVHTDGRVVAYELPAQAWQRACALSLLAGVPHCIYSDRGRGPARAFMGLGVLRLDADLDMWFHLDGAERRPVNLAASEIAAAFGVTGHMYGPVVFTGVPDGDGVTQDISVAATVLIAGMAAAHDAPDTGTDQPRGEQRAREFLALGIDTRHPDSANDVAESARNESTGGDLAAHALHDGDHPSAARGSTTRRATRGRVESFDALAHTVTADGDLPRCAECGEHGSHERCQPETVRAAETATAGTPLGSTVGR